MKKTISVILAIVLVLTALGFTSNAADAISPYGMADGELINNEDTGDVNLPTEESTEPESPDDEPTEPDEPNVPDEPLTWEDFDEVVEMYICATANSFTGHVWLYFVNLTECEVPLGYITLAPGEEMSVGSLRNTRTNGGGTYYNGEAMMAKKDVEKIRKHTTSLKMTLSPDQLKKVNQKICKKNSYDMIFNNCGVFATTIWNSVSKNKVIHIVFPVFTILSMKTYGAKKGALSMEKASQGERCFKQKRNNCEEIDWHCFEKDSCIG